MRIAVLAGGLSAEREVSLRSGRRVAQALREKGQEVFEVDIDADLLPELRKINPDVVLPLVHGQVGEDGSLREVLDVAGYKTVGSPSAAARIAFEKPIANQVAAAAGVFVPKSVVLPQEAFKSLGATALLDSAITTIGLPMVVKPSHGGSALGATVVKSKDELPAAMVTAFSYGSVVLMQPYITGTEIAVCVLEDKAGVRALPIVEIVPDHDLYDYDCRYTAGMTEFFVPARISEATTKQATEIAIKMHQALGLKDISRTDLIVDADANIWFLEVNINPGQTETSLFPQAVTAAGLDLGDVFLNLLTNLTS
ncbi:MAG: hypothetical protein RIT32_118 [Actinomycetota bacterium]